MVDFVALLDEHQELTEELILLEEKYYVFGGYVDVLYDRLYKARKQVRLELAELGLYAFLMDVPQLTEDDWFICMAVS